MAVQARLVLDTDVLVAAFRSAQGASRQLLYAALQQRFVLLVSVPLMMEYEAVLTRPEHLAAAGITRGEAGKVLDDLSAVATAVRISYLWRPKLPDPDDDMVLETAVNGDADGIVTFNQREFAEIAGQFHCSVLLPGAVLQRIRRGNP